MKFNNRNVWIDPSAKIGEGVCIGRNTGIYTKINGGDDVRMSCMKLTAT